MVVAALIGVPLGSLVGVVAGSHVFKGKLTPKNYLEQLDAGQDELDTGWEQDGPVSAKPVSEAGKATLRDLSPWLVHPDFQKTAFMNTILKALWPRLGAAVKKEVEKQLEVQLVEVKKKVKVLEGVAIDEITLGSRPPRLDSIRTLITQEDELILEAPLFWGGDISVRVTATLKLGPALLDIPVHVANVQLKALARVTVTPLVEELPCVGGVTLSLMEEPHVDCELRIGPTPDLMALPGVPQAVKMAIKMVVGKMLVYPNEISVPIMPNFGAPPPPKGMLHVKVVGASGLKSSFMDTVDPLVVMEVREGRPKRTTAIDNNPSPVWNEEFDFVVDSLDKQRLNILVEDFDLISNSVVGVAVVPFSGAEFVRHPRRTVALSLPLLPPQTDRKKRKDSKKAGEAEGEAAAAAAAANGGSAAVPGVAPATTPAGAATGVAAAAASAAAAVPPSPSASVSESIPDTPRSGSGSPHSSTSRFASMFKRKKKGSSGSQPVSPTSPAVAQGATSPASSSSKRILGKFSKKKALAPSPCGTLQLEVTFLPFKDAGEGGELPPSPPQDGRGGRPPAPKAPPTKPKPLRRMTTVKHSVRGVLTVDLKKCTGLEEGTNSYVEVLLDDRKTHKRQTFRSDIVLGEGRPRYEFKTDFVNIAAHSTLRANVYSISASGATGKLKSLMHVDKKPKLLGWVRTDVAEVARAGRIKDVWALQEADSGEMHLTLEWNTIEFNQDVLGEGEGGV